VTALADRVGSTMERTAEAVIAAADAAMARALRRVERGAGHRSALLCARWRSVAAVRCTPAPSPTGSGMTRVLVRHTPAC
jgi:hypothetical protein